MKAKARAPYHSLIPDDRHPLLSAVGALRNQSEVVLSHSLLGSVEGTVGATGDLEVPTGRKHTTSAVAAFNAMYLGLSREVWDRDIPPVM